MPEIEPQLPEAVISGLLINLAATNPIGATNCSFDCITIGSVVYYHADVAQSITISRSITNHRHAKCTYTLIE
jgi:hypothetical protein